MAATVRAARDAAIVAALVWPCATDAEGELLYWRPALNPTASGKQNLRQAAQLAERVLRDLGMDGVTWQNLLRSFRRPDTYPGDPRAPLWYVESRSDHPKNFHLAAMMIVNGHRCESPQALRSWARRRHEKKEPGKPPLFHPFELAREFHAEKRCKK
ncbi:MAG: hypothetical protein U1F10_08525 [Burkholderiales bacterium]